MEQDGSIFSSWAFQIPNLFLAALMYTLIGRFLLSIVFLPNSDKVLWRSFKTITDPFVATTRYITPAMVPARLAVVFSAIWVLLARVGLFLTFLAAGYKLGPGG